METSASKVTKRKHKETLVDEMQDANERTEVDEIQNDNEETEVDEVNVDNKEKFLQNEKKNDENVKKAKKSTVHTESHVQSYVTLVANMDQLRINIEKHLRIDGENSKIVLHDQNLAACAEKNADKNLATKGKVFVKDEMSAIEEENSTNVENYVHRFEKFAANAKLLTDEVTANKETEVDEINVANEEKSPQNEEKNEEKAKKPTVNTESHVLNYVKLVANMDELRINLENHVRIDGENSKTVPNDQSLAAFCAIKNDDENLATKENILVKDEFSAIEEENSTDVENYVHSFEKLAANAKLLTDDEVIKFEYIMQNLLTVSEEENPSSKKYTDNALLETPSSSKVNADVNNSDVVLNIENLLQENNKRENIGYKKEVDMVVADVMNSMLAQIGEIGYGALNLNDELELPMEPDSEEKVLKNYYNSIIQNNILTKEEISKINNTKQ